MEEIGCKVEIVSHLGSALQIRNAKAQKYEVQYFVANVIDGKGVPTSTQEDEQHVSIGWLPKQEVYELFKDQIKRIPEETYVMKFSSRMHLAAFERWMKE